MSAFTSCSVAPSFSRAARKGAGRTSKLPNRSRGGQCRNREVRRPRAERRGRQHTDVLILDALSRRSMATEGCNEDQKAKNDKAARPAPDEPSGIGTAEQPDEADGGRKRRHGRAPLGRERAFVGERGPIACKRGSLRALAFIVQYVAPQPTSEIDSDPVLSFIWRRRKRL